MQIFIKMLTGKVITVDADGNTTVGELKHKILDKEGIPVKQQRIIVAGKDWPNENILYDFPYKDEMTIHLVLRLPSLKDRIWEMERFLWIGHLKENASDCVLANIPTDLVKEIASQIRNNPY